MKEFAKLEKEKIKLSTTPWDKVSKLLEYYKDAAESSDSATGKILLGIFKRNRDNAEKGFSCNNSKLL
jgi:hypothetical protein